MSELSIAESHVVVRVPPVFESTFRVAETPLQVPPGGVLYVPIDVHGLRRPVTRLAVAVHLTHQRVGLIALSIESPGGTWVALSSFNGGHERCFGAGPAHPVVFDERADVSIVDAVAPITGVYRPEGDLGRYRLGPVGSLNGRWHLMVADAGGRHGAPAEGLAAALTFGF